MKKLLVFILILACCISSVFIKNDINPIFNFSNIDKVCIVSASNFQNDGEIESVACGDKYFNYCSLDVARTKIRELKNDFDAIQFYLSGNVDEFLNKMKFQLVSTSSIEGIEIYYGYTPYYQDCVFVDGKKVNMQVAVVGESIIAGFPLILTGYWFKNDKKFLNFMFNLIFCVNY